MEHVQKGSAHVMPDGKVNRARRYIARMIVTTTVFAKQEAHVYVMRISRVRPVAFRLVRCLTRRCVEDQDDV
jgi:hypothetical protein